MGSPRAIAQADTVSAKMSRDPAFAAEMIRSGLAPQLARNNRAPIFGIFASQLGLYTFFQVAPAVVNDLKNRAAQMFHRGILTAALHRPRDGSDWFTVEVIHQAPRPAGDWLVRNSTWTYPTVDGDFFRFLTLSILIIIIGLMLILFLGFLLILRLGIV